MKNFGMKSRDMGTAVRLALKIARDKKELSYSSVATLSERWNPFEQFIKTKGIRCLEDVGPDTLICYGQTLAELVKKGEIATATAQTRVSAINTIYCILTEGNWQSISPTHDCGIGKRKFVRSKAPPSEKELQTALADLTNQPLKQCLVLLCFYFGLRSKEASLLRINVLFAQSRHARNWGQIGPRTFKAFCKDNELAESTQRQYIVAIKKLEQLVGHKIRILKEINHETHSDD